MATFPIDIAALLEQGADPGATANTGKLYSKDAAGVTHLFFQADDGTVYQITPTPQPQIDTTYYVASTGNDANDGLTPATAFETFGKADSVIPTTDVDAIYRVRVLDDVAPFEFTGTQPRTFKNGGMVYWGGDVDNELEPPTPATAGTGAALVNAAVAWVPDAYAGRWIEFLDGDAAGEIRQILTNGAASLIPVVPYIPAATPAPGDSFRIFEPSIVVQETIGNGVIVLNGSDAPLNPSSVSGCFFERFFFDAQIRIGNKMPLSICTINGNIGARLNSDVRAGSNQIMGGTEARAAAIVKGVNNSAYYGAGVLFVSPGTQIATSFAGFFCAPGIATTVYDGHGYLRGGNFDAGLTFDGVFNAVQAVLVADSSTTPIRLAKLSAIRGAVVECERVTILAAAGNALIVNTAARVVIGATCTITATAATAVIVESQGFVLLLVVTAITAGGGAAGYGILARYGGTARFSGAPTVTGGVAGVNDFAIGNAPTLGASALFAAAGTALLPAVVIDGSIAQRI